MSANVADAKQIFLEAVENHEPESWPEFLQDVCGTDSILRERVEALLAAYRQPNRILDSSSHQATLELRSITEEPGTVIGPYKLLQQIGEGGMGVVFMAEQSEPIQRKVALKIIKPGMDTRQVIARFEAERQALAMMDHPNIAKVLDAGATDSGRPYFVMELVKGVPITKYCDDKQLSLRERLDLFKGVCQAVQHAHQKGVIHRDIKPTNVLVAEYDNHAVPKVIDFGVAKATAQKLTERTMFTEFGQVLGTVEYMSPEQAKLNQLDIDTRTDIYSLGVLLYELLTGSTPFEQKQLREAAFDEMLRIIREEEPPKPSTRLSTSDTLPSIAANRHTEPQRLSKEVSGELDWIVMKALEKDRNRRYETASAFAADIERHLHDEPVKACPPSQMYRLKKFIRRNKAGVLAGSAITAALAAGLVLASIGFIQARHQAEIAHIQAVRSEQVAQFLKEMLTAAGPGVARGRDATLLREILEKTVERVDKDLKEQPEVQGDLWLTLGQTYVDIGDYPRAIKTYQHAVASFRAGLGNENAKLALALGRLGSIQSRSGDTERGQINAELGLKMARRCGDKKVIARCLAARARTLHSMVLVSEATPLFREAITLVEEVGDDPVFLASLMRSLGGCLDEPGGRDEAESLMRQAIVLQRKHLDPDHPAIIGGLYMLAQCLTKQNKLEKAETIGREIVAQARKVYPTDHPNKTLYVGLLVGVLTHRDKPREAEAVLKEAVESSPTNGGYWNLSGDFNAQRGNLDVAVEQFSRAVELTPDDVYGSWNLAAILLKAGRIEEYRQHCHQFLERSGNTREAGVADSAAKSSLLLPVDGADFTRACELADFAATATGSSFLVPWMQLGKSLADYRRQRFDSSLEWAGRAIDSEGTSLCKAAALCIQACCHASLKQMDQALQSLAQSDKVMLDVRDQPWVNGGAWRDFFAVEFLRAEAVRLIGQPSAAAQPLPPAESKNSRNQTSDTNHPKAVSPRTSDN